MGVDGHFPENLGELMNSGHAPNVTLPVQVCDPRRSPLVGQLRFVQSRQLTCAVLPAQVNLKYLYIFIYIVNQK